MAWLFCRYDSQRYTFGVSKLTSEEARRIGKAISRIPEFMTQRQGFHPRGGGPRWRADRPYHVALEDTYVRAHWGEIDALCRLNNLPFNSTGETIQNDGVWRVYEFTLPEKQTTLFDVITAQRRGAQGGANAGSSTPFRSRSAGGLDGER